MIEHFTEATGLHDYALYLQDFGGPVGRRLAARVRALVIQNANAYEKDFSQGVREVVLRAYTNHSPEVIAKQRTFFEMPVTKHQSPMACPTPRWSVQMPGNTRSAGMDRPGNKEIQLALHTNYGSNVERYDEWPRYFREHQSPHTCRVG